MRTISLLLVILFLGPVLSFAQMAEISDYNDKNKRDPFLPLVSEDGRYLLTSELIYSSEGLTLTGILWDAGGNSSALINNEVVRKGESVLGYKIERIARNSVVVSKDNKEYTVKLFTEEEE